MIAAAMLLMACGTPESNAWGLPRSDVREIGRLVHAQTSSPILSYQRDSIDDTAILVFTPGREYPETYVLSGSVADGRSMKHQQSADVSVISRFGEAL